MNKKIIMMFSLLTLAMINVIYASTSEWSEIKRYTGSESRQFVCEFICNRAEWRIKWEYGPTSKFARFCVYIFHEPDSRAFVSIEKEGREETNGITYIHNVTGTFFLNIIAEYTWTYTIIIEEDLSSIPEFPSFLVLSLFMIATLLAVIVYKRKH